MDNKKSNDIKAATAKLKELKETLQKYAPCEVPHSSRRSAAALPDNEPHNIIYTSGFFSNNKNTTIHWSTYKKGERSTRETIRLTKDVIKYNNHKTNESRTYVVKK
ncbi:hypothetical protein LbFV_ORF17 [Leptopilina boulardi filamentous virus]|uniref:Uncharacterized protein n=1 Tax=Leptopilina boulardi filamentous virus TaxID=552509 RepID=A0A1S5YD59_9VIRU|nr:hypothetical protein LbFV_ORF17 [Leptopilina boulardi filamentous virus]AQQ79937.1 hypothetical protein LbFV_ORF17 [Leptopilina boulardi filamentous virus]